MFAPDVVSLRQFYATPLGLQAHALIAASLHQIWPDAGDDTVLGIGYSTPYLTAFLDRGSPVFVCMPAAQGAAYWPPAQANRVFLSHESELPLAENSVNRVLLVHSVENSEQLSWMMREIWRVLTPGGRVLAMVPNRLGFWSRAARSPFGYGRPFSMAQLRDLMGEHDFTVTRSASALFTPPMGFRWLWRLAPYIEKFGKIFLGLIGGVLLVEAEKQVYAAIKQPVASRASLRTTVPAAKPAMSGLQN